VTHEGTDYMIDYFHPYQFNQNTGAQYLLSRLAAKKVTMQTKVNECFALNEGPFESQLKHLYAFNKW
jgi:hypothetical protein